MRKLVIAALVWGASPLPQLSAQTLATAPSELPVLAVPTPLAAGASLGLPALQAGPSASLSFTLPALTNLAPLSFHSSSARLSLPPLRGKVGMGGSGIERAGASLNRLAAGKALRGRGAASSLRAAFDAGLPRTAASVELGSDVPSLGLSAVEPQPSSVLASIPDLDERYAAPAMKARTVIMMGSSKDSPQVARHTAMAGELAGELVRRGYNILTSAGNAGILGAVTKAAYEAGRAPARDGGLPGQNLGIMAVPLFGDEDFERVRAIGKSESESARVEKFHRLSDVFVIFPGGTATLQEAATLISKNKYRGEAPAKKVILVGRDYFAGLSAQYEGLQAAGLLGAPREELFKIVDSVEEALRDFPALAGPREAVPAAVAPVKKAGWRPWVPNLITSFNLTSGFGSIVASSNGHLGLAAALILLANVFDLFDGRAARALKVDGPLGVELDSLADLGSFGVAAGFLIYKAGLQSLGPVGFAVAAAFAAAGMYRLARFNVSALDKSHAPTDHFTGLPIPGGAGIVSLLALALPHIASPWAAVAAVAGTLLAAAAMVSRLPYPNFKHGGLAALAGPAGAVGAAALGLTFLGHLRYLPAAIFGMYLVVGPVNKLYRSWTAEFQSEFRRKLFHQALLLYLAAYIGLGAHSALLAMLPWTAFVGALETVRLRTEWGRRKSQQWLGGIIREKEANRYTGTFYATLGILGTFLFFGARPHIVAASILYLTLGDATTALVGRKLGRHTYKVRGETRSYEGTFAGLAVALVAGFVAGLPLWAIWGGALAFMLADIIPVRPDDNFWIPLFTGLVLLLIGVR